MNSSLWFYVNGLNDILVNQFRIRGRGRARGVFAGTNTGPSNSNTTFQKRPKEEEWDPEYTPKSKKYFLVGVENSISYACFCFFKLSTSVEVACMYRQGLQLRNHENTRVGLVPGSASLASVRIRLAITVAWRGINLQNLHQCMGKKADSD